MKIYTKLLFRMEDGGLVLLNAESYDYWGPVDLCGGDDGSTPESRAASTHQLALSDKMAGIAGDNQAQQKEIFNTIKPFGTSRMNGGLPFFNALTDYNGGIVARSFAAPRARLLRSLGSQSGLPSGFRQGAISDFDSSEARTFDQGIQQALFANEQAKQQGAQILSGQAGQLNPLGWYQATQQGYNPQQYMTAPTPGAGGAIAGAVGGLGSAAIGKLPF